MRAAPLAICHVLKEKNIEPVMELASQYRNRLALQADLLGAAILGVENVLLTKGFDPSMGDHAEAQPVHDLDCVALVKAAVNLTKGADMTGHALNEAPDFCLGVAAIPEWKPNEAHLAELKEKVSLGASYIQTQPLYEPEVLERFLGSIRGLHVPVIAGHVMLKSASMARFISRAGGLQPRFCGDPSIPPSPAEPHPIPPRESFPARIPHPSLPPPGSPTFHLPSFFLSVIFLLITPP